MEDVHDQKGTIVVVDDEPNIADLVDMYLARDGFRVLKAPSGEAGLQAVKDHRPRLVVLDVGLPDIDGLEVCKRLRATSQIPVIFLTARDSEVDRVVRDTARRTGQDEGFIRSWYPWHGDAERIAQVIGEYADAGIDYFIVNVPNAFEGGVMSRFAEEVFPRLGLK